LKGSGRLCTQAGSSRQHLRFLPPLPACHPCRCPRSPTNRAALQYKAEALALSLALALPCARPCSSTSLHHCYRPGLQQQQRWVATPHRGPSGGTAQRGVTGSLSVPRARLIVPPFPLHSTPTPTPFCSSSTSSPLRELDDTQSERERGRGAADPGAELLYLPVLVGAEARSSSCSPVLPATVGLPPSPCS
jgi:hypothetical protein